MKHDEIRKKAKKKVEAKKGFYIVAIIFASVSALLLVISLMVGGPAAFWIRFPMLVFALVLTIMYVAIFGLPGSGVLSQDWEAEEMEKEMYNLYRREGLSLPPPEDLSEEEQLELKELERLKRKWEHREDDFV